MTTTDTHIVREKKKAVCFQVQYYAFDESIKHFYITKPHFYNLAPYKIVAAWRVK